MSETYECPVCYYVHPRQGNHSTVSPSGRLPVLPMGLPPWRATGNLHLRASA